MTVAEIPQPRRPRRSVLAAAMAMIGLAGATGACADTGPVDLSVVDRDTGQVLRVWRHHGHLFVAGHPGARYGLRVTNHSDGRVLVVLSVDGVNVVSGETAGYDQRGYVFGPYESYDVTGWRKSDSEVAAFTFAPLPQSYAARTGRPEDVGVIGMAVFREKPVAIAVPGARYAPRARPGAPLAQPAPPPPSAAAAVGEVVVTAQRRAAPAAPAATASPDGAPPEPQDEPQDAKLGTAHGARERSVVTQVDFERATPNPQWVQRIEYDTYDRLVAQGVIPPYERPAHRPRPFPSETDGAGYVPDPPDEP